MSILAKIKEWHRVLVTPVVVKTQAEHKITCAVYNINRKPCDCGAGEGVKP